MKLSASQTSARATPTASGSTRSRSAAQLHPLRNNTRYVVLPSYRAEKAVSGRCPRDVVMMVTAPPTWGLEPTLALTERLAASGCQPSWLSVSPGGQDPNSLFIHSTPNRTSGLAGNR